jgi:hypothetical protein
MPIEFLTDEQAGKYGQFAGVPSRAQLERFFFLNDADLIGHSSSNAGAITIGWASGSNSGQ